MSIKEMAYGGGSSKETHGTFRLERGFPFMRNGRFVRANPRWKGLKLFSHTSENAPTYQTTSSNVQIEWPSPPAP